MDCLVDLKKGKKKKKKTVAAWRNNPSIVSKLYGFICMIEYKYHFQSLQMGSLEYVEPDIITH